MERIHKIDNELTQLFEGIESIAHSLPFAQIGELLQVNLESIKFPGLYFIEVWVHPTHLSNSAAWMDEFRSTWGSEEFKKCFVPSCQKTRMNKHKVLQEWMPVYLGKSKSIGHRVGEHLNLEKEKSTFALKLKARNLLEGNRFRLSVMRLSVVNYDVLAPKLEAALRRKLHPLVGRQ